MVCYQCMGTYTGSVCPRCGFSPERYQPFPDALRPGTVLKERYIMGVTLGKGGFGTTYVGWDQNEGRKVAVKEYFPAAITTRDIARSNDVEVCMSRELYEAGVRKFYDEAAALARLTHISCIVEVYDFFYANHTAYIVMEHIEGKPIDQLVREQGPLDLGLVFTIYYPIVEALAEVHREGLLHRDIAPNNIILDPCYQPRLIDFGASRAFSQEISTDMSVILKNGFAPVEQYTRRGRHGPKEDVYALCASMYYCLTGKIPPASTDRLVFDTLRPLSDYGVEVPPSFEALLARGMAIRAEDRCGSMEELLAGMEQLVAVSGPEVPAQGRSGPTLTRPEARPALEQRPQPRKEPRTGKGALVWILAACGVAAVAALTAAVVWFLL